MEKTDSELVALARAGHKEAFGELIDRHQARAIRVAAGMVRHEEAAREVVQEALLLAYLSLDRLREDAGFASWLHGIVRNVCRHYLRDRKPECLSWERLEEEASWTGAASDPELIAEQRERERLVLDAVHALSPANRATTLLFYYEQRSLQEIAATLNITVGAVKSRLHQSRKQLKERLLPLYPEALASMPRGGRTRKMVPEKSVGRSLAETVAEFHRQRAANPATADRSLLQAGRKQLEGHLQRSRWEPEVVHPGQSLLDRLGDYAAIADLLSRYLTQPLSVSEEAWACWHLVDSLALCGRCEEVVAKQQEFLAWAQSTFPTQPPSLSRDMPFEPVGEEGGARLSEDSLFPWVMGDGGQAMCWVRMAKGEEWLQIFHDLMAVTPATPENRFRRFNYLRTASLIAAKLRRGDEALRIAGRIGALAVEAASAEEALGWKMEASVAELRVHQEAQNTEAVRRAGPMAAALMEEYERERSPMNAADRKRLRSFCHNTAAPLYWAAAYDLAIPLLRRVVEDGTLSPWPYIWLAASLWATTNDRTQVLPLLEQASYRYRGELWPECRKLREFASVGDDPQFQRAAAIASAGKPATNE